MKNLLIGIFVLVCLGVQGQNKKNTVNPYKNLETVESFIPFCSISNGIYYLGAKYSDDNKLIKISMTVPLIDPFLDVIQHKNKDEHKYMTKYKSSIINYLEGVSRFGENKGNVIIYKEPVFNVGFLSYNSALTFYQTGIYHEYFLNTLKLNANERALKIANDVAIPSIYNFKELLNDGEIKYFTIIISYTAKNFSEDYSDDTETIALVVSRLNVSKYIKAEITDEILLKNSVLYNINKATGINIKKIST